MDSPIVAQALILQSRRKTIRKAPSLHRLFLNSCSPSPHLNACYMYVQWLKAVAHRLRNWHIYLFIGLKNRFYLQTKEWWTYEFCFKREIKQYHVESMRRQNLLCHVGVMLTCVYFYVEDKVVGKVISLGIFSSEFDWSEAEKEAGNQKVGHSCPYWAWSGCCFTLVLLWLQNSLPLYHSHEYVNGTTCDITGEPRKTQVRVSPTTFAESYLVNCDICAMMRVCVLQFVCSHKGTEIRHVQETETCVYLLTVGTELICDHPLMTQNIQNKASKPIRCEPLLEAEEYIAFKQREEREKREREKNKQHTG